MTKEEHNRVIVRAVALAILGVLLTYVLYLVRDVLLTVYTSAMLAIGLSPAVRWIERKRFTAKRFRVPRWIAILALYLGVLAVIASVAALVLPALISQIKHLIESLPGYADRLQRQFVEWKLVTPRWSWSELFKNMDKQLPGLAVAGVFTALQGAFGVFGKIITVLILPFYLLLEAGTIRRAFLGFFEDESRPRVNRVINSVTVKVGGWFGGQLLLGAVIGTSTTVVLWLLGVPYFYVLGLIAAFGELIPVIGPILASVPAILLGFTISIRTGVIVAIFFWVQQIAENNLLVPRIMQRQVGVSPVTILVALLIGSELLGIIGAVLAVPSAAIIQVLLQARASTDDDDE